MSSKRASSTGDLSGLLQLESSVLRTLCLSINAEAVDVKKQILDRLASDDFYFPVTRSIFGALLELDRAGDEILSSGLESALGRRSVAVPDDFYLEDLFSGELPPVEALNDWISDLKGEETKIQSNDGGVSMERLEKTHPNVSLAPPSDSKATSSRDAVATDDNDEPLGGLVAAELPEPAEAAVRMRARATSKKKDARPKRASSTRSRKKTPAKAKPESRAGSKSRAKSAHPPTSAKRAARSTASKTKASISDSEPKSGPVLETKNILAPEGGEWLGYLAELTKKQGERFKTGFRSLDSGWGGVGPGLLLLAGEEQARLLDFLKQLVDQVASRCRVPCLYLSFERSKAELRLQTLSRLSLASASDIEHGRFDKDSPEWQNVVRVGEQAVEWLQRIYVVESKPDLAVTNIREIRESLIGSGAGPTCLIAVDNLEKLGSGTDLLASVAELKELAESLGIVVIGAATNWELVHERSADMTVTLRDEVGASMVEVLTAGDSQRTPFRFNYHRETHRFEEGESSED